MTKRRLVLALGGNAIIKEQQRGEVAEQFSNTREAVISFSQIIREGHEVTLTHGNGPQVGNIMIRVRASQGMAYDLPLGMAVAETQGEMGYMLARAMQDQLEKDDLDRSVVALITQVIVDPKDPSMINPTKPIGPFFTKEESEVMNKEGVKMVEDAGRGYRMVVPSPRPQRIQEGPVIRKLLEEGVIVVAGGGGGIPVYLQEKGLYRGVNGVVDKDLTSALIAREVGAQDIAFLTGVEKVALNFNTPQEKHLDKISLSEAKQWLEDGQFPAGSMGPKIRAAIEFIEGGGERALITLPEKTSQAYLEEETGTWILPD